MGRHTPPEFVKAVFNQASNGKDFLTAQDFVWVLHNLQFQHDITEEDAASIISGINSHKKITTLDIKGFMKYLLNPSLNAAHKETSQEPTQDMSAPLPHYYVYTSHNSYLTGNQLTSKSCTSPIVAALRMGCRVIELDCWERNGKIMVLHGNTLTKAVSFEECVRAIKENAFVASKFPVIITIENHLSPPLQEEAAKILKDIIGNELFIPPDQHRNSTEFLSPMVLKGKIIISDAPPKQHIINQVVTDPKGALDAIPPNSTDKDDSSDDDSSKSYSSDEQEPENTNPIVTSLEKLKISDDDVTPKVPALQELIYIYCAKPSEMDTCYVKGELVSGESAIMANMSEAQLQKSVSQSPHSLIRYTKSNLGRMYPFGLRFDSSNADPMVAWSHGFQLAAINMQGRDRSRWITHSFFLANGNCGYVKKPSYLLEENNLDLLQLSPKIFLKVKVLMGCDWHKRFDMFSKPDFYTKVAMHGVQKDKRKFTTQTSNQNTQPNWEAEEFVFPITVPELAILRLEVWEADGISRHDFVGQACFHVQELRNGIRAVQLRSKKGEPKSSKLLCYLGLHAGEEASVV